MSQQRGEGPRPATAGTWCHGEAIGVAGREKLVALCYRGGKAGSGRGISSEVVIVLSGDDVGVRDWRSEVVAQRLCVTVAQTG